MFTQRRIMINLFILVALMVFLADVRAVALTFTFNRAIPSPDSNIFALGFGDDGFLWVHSQDSKIIYKLDPATGNVIQSFPSNITTYLADIDVREGILYGGEELTIFRYNTSDGTPLPPLTGPVVGGSRGITFVGADLYVSGVLAGFPEEVRLGRIDTLTGDLLASCLPPELGQSNGIGAIGQNVGYLVNPMEYGDVILYIVDPVSGKLIESHILFQEDYDIRSLDASTKELFISRRDLNQIWVYDIIINEWQSVYDLIFKGADSEEALALLRRYRDWVLMANPVGRDLVFELYKDHSIQLAKILLTHPGLALRSAKMIKDNLAEIANVIDGGKITMTPAKLAEVSALLGGVVKVSNPDLRAYLLSVKKVLQKEDALANFGIKVENEEIKETPKLRLKGIEATTWGTIKRTR